MSNKLRGLVFFLAFAFVLCVVSTVETRAEVSARTDRDGNYVTTQVAPLGTGSSPQVWSVRSKRFQRSMVLNSRGDYFGDSWPKVFENSSAPYHPWVLWTRPAAGGLEMMYSRWNPGGWERPDFVQFNTTRGSDGEPGVGFDEFGRPYLVWTRLEEGVGRIYVSVFLVTRWTDGFLVSDHDMDSRTPTIQVRGEGHLSIQFETSDGTFSQDVLFLDPVTITDDINPQNHFSLNGSPTYVRKND
ncbi:MAG: hypothetical protein GY716_24230 [bacterium]|nr:hypothetical protein [bacterium]